MTDTHAREPDLLPVLIPDEPNIPFSRSDVVEMALSLDEWNWLHAKGCTLQDALDGKVPDIDPDELIERQLGDCLYVDCSSAFGEL